MSHRLLLSQTLKPMLHLAAPIALALLLFGCGRGTDPSGPAEAHEPTGGRAPTTTPTLEPLTVNLAWGQRVARFDVSVSQAAMEDGTLRLLGTLQHGKLQSHDGSFQILMTPGWVGVDSVLLELALPDQAPQRAWIRIEASGPEPGDTSVQIAHSAQALTLVERNRYLPGEVDDPRLAEIRPLVREILRDYGNPTSEWDRARALRDWVARTAVHPYAPFHPDGSLANTLVLPSDVSWADFNATIALREARDNSFWLQRHYDGYAMLDTLLGTFDHSSARRNDDGLLRHLGRARYQMRDLESFRSVYCSYQGVMLRTLLLAEGWHGIGLMLTDHEATAVFLPSFGKWVYLDPTFNESFYLAGREEPLSPLEIFDLRQSGNQFAAHRRRGLTPLWDAARYIARSADSRATYFGNNPTGMPILGVVLNSRDAYKKNEWGGYYDQRLAVIDTPEVDNYWPYSRRDAFARLTREEAFPDLGVRLSIARPTVDSVTVALESNQPQSTLLQRQLNQEPWRKTDRADRFSLLDMPKRSVVRYRSIDIRGNPSAVAELRVRGNDDGPAE